MKKEYAIFLEGMKEEDEPIRANHLEIHDGVVEITDDENAKAEIQIRIIYPLHRVKEIQVFEEMEKE